MNENNQSIFDILKIMISSVLLCNFPKVSRDPPPN
jgi:hypothetical protein